MKKINIDNWKEFRVGDLFEVHPTKNLKKTNIDLFADEGGIPVIVNSAFNNGVGGYVPFAPTEKGGIITFSDTTDANSIFYQENDFIGYSHVQGMYPKFKKQSKHTMRFITTIFKSKALTIGYNYSNKFTRDNAINLIIKLPTTPDGEPDWQYMEDYMKKVMVETQKKIEQFKRVNCDKKSVDIGEWKEFRVGDLLENENKCVYGKDKKWVENEKPDSNSIPVVSGTTFNNGVTYYTNEKPSEDEVFENCLTITTRGEYSGTMFYHEGKFVLANNILVLPFKCKNIYQSLFIKIVIDRLGYGGYDNYPTRNKIIEDIIKLPVTPDGEPDWQYMEDYVKKSINKAKKNLNSFKKAEF